MASAFSAAAEGVEHRAAFRAAGENARLNERFGEGGEVGALEALGRDGPDVALVAGLYAFTLPPAVTRLSEICTMQPDWTYYALVSSTVTGARHRVLRYRLLDRLRVEVVPLALAQQEHVLVRLGAAVAHALRHRVRLVPDDVLPQIPAISLQGERDAPRDAH